MIPRGADIVLVRHRELGTKSARVQGRMEAQLERNLEAMLDLRKISGSVTRERGRLFIHTSEDAIDDATDAAAATFGVASASPAISIPPTLDAITSTLARLAPDVYPAGTFAVRARRAGKRSAHPFSSNDIEFDGGAAIWEAVESTFPPEVDLDDPDVTFFVECRQERAYVFFASRDGPGGFPLGAQGRVVSLISGGIDSPVAAWEIMRRGCEIVPVYFDFEAYGGPDHVARAESSVRQLATFAPGADMTLYRAPIGEAVETMVEHVHRTRMLTLRRLMFAVAAAIATDVDAHGLVTGESLGQKSSQTGPNLAVTSNIVELPIYRPLLTRDKQDIISQAKRIGTYEEATINAGCNRVAPDYPETNAREDDVVSAEPPDFFERVDQILDRTEAVVVSPTTEPPVAMTPTD